MTNNATDWAGRVVRITAKFEAMARANDVRVLGVAFPDGHLPVEMVEGPSGAVVLDAMSPGLLAGMSEFARPETQEALLRLAGEASAHGVTLRCGGELVYSYAAARVGLFGSCVLGDPRGVSATSANVWVLREAVRDVLDRAGGGSRSAFAEAGVDARAYGEALRDLLTLLRSDAADACPLVERLVGTLGEEAPPSLLHAWHRLVRMSSDPHGRRREVRARLRASAEMNGAWDVLLRSAADEVAQANIVDVLVSARALPPTAAEDGNDAYDAFDDYAAAHEHVVDLGADVEAVERAASELANATRHLAYLRLSATMSGGAFAHQLAYLLAQYLHLVGRDFVFLLRRLGRDEEALATTEAVLARSMVDWATRTHGILRILPEVRAAVAPLTGSVASTAVLGLPEVCAVAVEHGPLLYLLRQPDGYAVWLVRTDGRVLSLRIDDPEPVLAPLFRALPYLEGTSSDLARQISGSPSVASGEANLDALLAAAYGALIPAELDAALQEEALAGEERLIVVPDARLEPVPFAALRTPRRRYFAEERELSTAPSATALELLGASRKRRPLKTVARRLTPGSLVLGRSRFDEVLELQRGDGVVTTTLAPLPGAAAEARRVAALLGVEPLLDTDATATALLSSSSGPEVVHVVTHGYYDQSHPLDSFLVLADRLLSADELYRFDPGVLAGLVVLSACQTALGGEHPDSMIGLSNAFLIAGAHVVVSSLWLIPDDLTAPLMERFHQLVREGKPVAAALRTTQREALSAPATSAPRAWAAFRASGCAT